MNLAERLTLLYDIKHQIQTELVNKGASITDATPLSQYPEKIRTLPSGGNTQAYEAIIEALNTTLENIKLALMTHPYGVLDETQYDEIPEILLNFVDRDGIKTHIRGFNAIKDNITFTNLEETIERI